MSDLSATERCVKCGLCLPHCPTFALTGNEADSPRGRISLMQMLDQVDAELSPGLFRHLDQCLQCGACESMCPSKVPFGDLMDTARAQLAPHRQRSLGERFARKAGFSLVGSRTGRALARALLNSYQASRLDKLMTALPGIPRELKRRQKMLPPRSPAYTRTAGADASHGSLDLFVGCTGTLFDQLTLNSTQNLLTRLGYKLNTPAKQTCCGALHRHNGEVQAATRLEQENLAAFANHVHPIISFASGCTAQLNNYQRAHTDAENFSRRVTDIMHFLATRDAPLPLRALPEKISVHIPCTHRNALQQQASMMKVLNWIPEVELVVLNPQGGCCGAAGSYMLTQPELSRKLGEAMTGDFNAAETRILVTTNIGCALQLRAETQSQDCPPEIIHPVTLLERLLIDTAHQPLSG